MKLKTKFNVHKKRAVVIFLLLFLGAAFFVYYGQKNGRNGELFYSGTIEATQSHLSFQTGGRVLQVAVREGEAVVRGRILAELDPAEIRYGFPNLEEALIAKIREVDRDLAQSAFNVEKIPQ